ncbi:hypothetical protein GGR56DRAFT_626037 [Xylariaceae sp. FL0804]|nr:hypothetical protein GGR56DRAFT_626037 [Xylariaceae sp. FL0804]
MLFDASLFKATCTRDFYHAAHAAVARPDLMRAPVTACRGVARRPGLLSYPKSLEQPSRPLLGSRSAWLRGPGARSQAPRSASSSAAAATATSPAKGAAPDVRNVRSQPSNPAAAAAVPRSLLPVPGAHPRKAANAPLSVGFAQRLAQKANPTTLYELAPQKTFLAGSFSAAFTCWSAAAWHFLAVLPTIPKEAAWWVPLPYGCETLFMAFMGARFGMMPANMIKSIKVLPASHLTKTSASNNRKPAFQESDVRLEIRVRRAWPIPGLPPKTLIVAPHEVVMKARMYNREPWVSPKEKMLQRQKEEERRKAERQHTMDHLMTSPFRDFYKVWRRFFNAFKNGMTGEGAAPIYIKDTKYKLDITDGYVLDEGQALDRIVRIEEDPRVTELRARLAKKDEYL